MLAQIATLTAAICILYNEIEGNITWTVEDTKVKKL